MLELSMSHARTTHAFLLILGLCGFCTRIGSDVYCMHTFIQKNLFFLLALNS